MNLFPKAGMDGATYGVSSQSRNALMTALLSKLIESPSDAPSLLRDAKPMLLEPFTGVPEAGSIYGEESSTLEEKIEKYEAVMSARISSAKPEQAAALQSMLLFVLDELGFEQTEEPGVSSESSADETLRLRGGASSHGGSTIFQIDSAALCNGVDAALRETERGAKALRKSLRPLIAGPTMTDALIAGAFTGFATGKILVGDPKLLAMAGSASFAYAHKYPLRVHPSLRKVSRRCSELAHEAREHFTK